MSAAALLGIIIGAILGLTGAGGGMLAVPALVAGLGWSMQQAAPVALIAISFSAALGALDGLRRRLLRWRGALLMACAGAPMIWVGGMLAGYMPQTWLQAIFACAMLAAAARMWRQNAPGREIENQAASGPMANVSETTGRFVWTWPTALLLGGIGSISGLLTGMLGVGGGFIMVPLLRRFSNVSMHGIVATSLAVIALLGILGVFSSLAHGVIVPWREAGWFSASCALGMLIGRKLARHAPASLVQRVFAGLLVLIASAILWRALV